MKNIENISDVSLSDFWDDCYNTNNTGWDLGEPTPIFVNWCDQLKTKKNICVPGCGNGYDVLYFAQKGHKVTAIDFAQNPIQKIKKESRGNNLNIDILEKDIFDVSFNFRNEFDYIIEYTFYCAIDPKMRIKYVEKMYNALKPGGEFVGIFLPFNKGLSEGGPPFGVDLAEIMDIFLKKFKLLESAKHQLSIKPRSDKEMFIRFIK